MCVCVLQPIYVRAHSGSVPLHIPLLSHSLELEPLTNIYPVLQAYVAKDPNLVPAEYMTWPWSMASRMSQSWTERGGGTMVQYHVLPMKLQWPPTFTSRCSIAPRSICFAHPLLQTDQHIPRITRVRGVTGVHGAVESDHAITYLLWHPTVNILQGKGTILVNVYSTSHSVCVLWGGIHTVRICVCCMQSCQECG